MSFLPLARKRSSMQRRASLKLVIVRTGAVWGLTAKCAASGADWQAARPSAAATEKRRSRVTASVDRPPSLLRLHRLIVTLAPIRLRVEQGFTDAALLRHQTPLAVMHLTPIIAPTKFIISGQRA